MAKAMFPNLRAFAVFNAKPHLFTYGQPYQVGVRGAQYEVFVDLKAGDPAQFQARVEQFGGVVLAEA